MKKSLKVLFFVLVVFALLLTACGGGNAEEPMDNTPANEPANEPARRTPDEPGRTGRRTRWKSRAGLTCDEPIKVGLITDASGALAIYGAHILRSFMLGMEYATGAAWLGW